MFYDILEHLSKKTVRSHKNKKIKRSKNEDFFKKGLRTKLFGKTSIFQLFELFVFIA